MIGSHLEKTRVLFFLIGCRTANQNAGNSLAAYYIRPVDSSPLSVSQSPAVTATLWPTVTRRLPPPKLAIIYAS